ncbi:diguanylate cyclase [Trichloromonas sp.]|uniref:diguanylate cyclase n=1 Tax=Trichloromonas sp. TaxID=3069249 RepID=UPI002A428636|nr:diguanylate cyclase [Trichloromonas sp.]
MEGLIRKLLQESGNDDIRLVAGIERLATCHGDEVYQEALRQLTSKNFPHKAAREHWRHALLHRDRLFPANNRSGRLRAALLDYLHAVTNEIDDPRIVEGRHLETIRQASITDGLTGLYHQTYYKAHLEHLLDRRTGSGDRRFAVVLLDLDHFKQYNDRCGHLAGDQALRRTAEILQFNLHQGDLACRYGGEEFALLLHRAGQDDAFAVAERIRAAVEETAYLGQELMDRGNLTISAGIAVYPTHGASAMDLLALADEELYRAKEQRNCISPPLNGQRREIRHRRLSLVEFTLAPGEPFQPGLSFDISRTGLSFGCSFDQLAAGAVLGIRFRQPFWPVTCELDGRVRHVEKQQENGLVRIGLEFVDLPASLLQLLPERPRMASLFSPSRD